MTTETRPDARVRRLHANEGDALDLIETEMAVLARALERLQRRSEIYRDLDRASYLIARTMEITGSVSINRLASVLGLDATTVTRQVATMEATRLVVRRADRNDGRVTLVSLSENGRRKMRAVQLARKERVERLLVGWSENDRRELGRLLAKFNDELSRDIADIASAETGHQVRKRSSRSRA
jgi:DNA-binding MarR family transcriptional regulator